MFLGFGGNRFGRCAFLMEEDGGGGGGNNGGNNDGGGKVKPSELVDRFNGDAVRMAEKLSDVLNDNHTLRQKNQTLTTDKTNLTTEVTNLKGKVPAEGTVVLSKEDAALWDAYKSHGTPDEFKKAKDDNVSLQAEQEKIQQDILLRDVADNVAPGEKYNLKVLQDRVNATPGLTFEVKDFEGKGADGKPVKGKKTFVKFKDGEGDSAPVKELALSDFATQKWGDFLPALRVEPADGQTSGTRHVAQGSGGQSASGSVFDRIRSEEQERGKADKEQAPSVFAAPASAAS